jgi:hypothetical protein
MSKPVLFYGKPNQLKDVFTYVRVSFLVNATSEYQNAPELAKLFRGSALSWLTNELKVNGHLLDDYDTFVEQVQSSFGLSTAAATSQAARKYANCYQKASVQLYAIEFKQLSSLLSIPDATTTAQFTKGLKHNVREALIINDEDGNLDDVIKEATRIDSQMFSSKRGSSGFSRGKGAFRGHRATLESATPADNLGTRPGIAKSSLRRPHGSTRTLHTTKCPAPPLSREDSALFQRRNRESYDRVLAYGYDPQDSE